MCPSLIDQQETIVNKLVPYDTEAEKALLGLFLSDNRNIDKVNDIVALEHFYTPIHQKVYSAIIKCIERGYVATPLTLKNFLVSDGFFEKNGDDCYKYLIELVGNADLVVDIKSLARVIHELYMRRQLILIGKNIVEEAYNGNMSRSAHDTIELVEQNLFNLTTYGALENTIVPLERPLTATLEHVDAIMRGTKKTSGLSTGFYEIDKLTGGLHNSDLIIIAARPSMGKTSFAINIALNIAREYSKEAADKQAVLIFSLEMSSEQVANRFVSIYTKIDSSKIRTGSISQTDFVKLSNASQEISLFPLFIDDSAAPTIASIRSRARRMKRKHNIGIVVIDYLQLIRPVSTSSQKSRVQEIGEVSQGLKALAKELNIPVIALSQLSRAVETREDKRPQLSDLRESGNIEQDADIVAFIYRAEYYLERKRVKSSSGLESASLSESISSLSASEDLEDAKNLAEIILAKQRNGPIGSAVLYFDSKTTEFANLTSQHSSF